MKSILLIISIVFCGVANAQYTKLLDFSLVTNAITPKGPLISDGTFLYGMTTDGGVNDLGVIFKVKTDGTGYLEILHFAGVSNGSSPYGSLISDGTFLYGMTGNGGSYGYGTVFKIMHDGTGYVKLLDFNKWTNGSYPLGSLISDGVFLYGMTSEGGVSNYGTIFKIMTNGTGYIKLKDFVGIPDGSYPNGALIFDGTFLYGTTSSGGINGMGMLFKITPNGTGFLSLLDFDANITGIIPTGPPVFDGTYLCGTTSLGGTNGSGTIFKIMPNGTGYAKIMDFDGVTNGSYPLASLIYDGVYLYGMTLSGGINNLSTIYKYEDNNITTVDENNMETCFTIYPNPSSGEISIHATRKDQYKIEIYNVLGKLVYRKISNLGEQMSNAGNSNSESVNLSSESNGVYFVNIKTEKGTVTKKIIINK